MVLATGTAQAQTGADFFKGKTVTYIVSTGPGGGYDLYGRLVAEYMQNGSLGRRINIEVRAADDGVAFRYVIPQTTPLVKMLIEDECVIAPVYFFLGAQFYNADKLGGVEANLIDQHPLR